MNKVFLGLILAVCVLGMALVMLNDRLGRRPESKPAHEMTATVDQAQQAMEASARAKEIAEAAKRPETPDEQPIVEKRFEPAPLPAPIIEEIEPVPAPKPQPAQAPVQAPTPPPAPVAIAAPPKTQHIETPKAPEPAPQPAPKVETPKQEENAKPAKPAAQEGSKTATRFVVYARDKGATVRMGGDGKMDYSSMNLENPDRVVVDITGDWKFPPNPGVPKNDLVSAVRVGKNGNKTRIVIDLKEKPRKINIVPFKDGKGVDVRVDK